MNPKLSIHVVALAFFPEATEGKSKPHPEFPGLPESGLTGNTHTKHAFANVYMHVRNLLHSRYQVQVYWLVCPHILGDDALQGLG